MRQLLEYIRTFYETHNIYKGFLQRTDLLTVLTETQKYRQNLKTALQPISKSDLSAPFKAFITPKLAEELEEVDKQADTIKGQQDIIEAAGKGDRKCALYLYINFLGYICSIFWNRLIPAISMNGQIQIDEDDLNSMTYEMVAIAIEMLCGGTPGEAEGRHANVYRTFKPEVYTEKGLDFNLFDHFGFYFRQYFADEVSYMIRRYRNQGFTGIAGNAFAPRQSSYEGMTSAMNHDTDDYISNNDALSLADTEDFGNNLTAKEMVKDFRRFLATKPDADILIKIWDAKAYDLKPEQISKETGLDKYTIQKLWKNMQNWCKARYSKEDFID